MATTIGGPGGTKFIATDNEQGRFSALVWNRSPTEVLAGLQFTVPTSLKEGAQLWVLRIKNQTSQAAVCTSYALQDQVSLATEADSAAITIHSLPPLEALLLSTEPCGALANCTMKKGRRRLPTPTADAF